MNEVVDQFSVYLEKVDFNQLAIPCINSYDGTLITEDAAVRNRVIGHLNMPIDWIKVLARLADYDLIIEIGPGQTLSDMVKNLYPDKQVIAINKSADVDALQEIITQPNHEIKA